MVRETRHLWVGNLPDNIREDRIREHFKRYGRVQSVKLLPRVPEEKTGEITMACTVAFMDIKSASKAHNAELKIDDRTLNTEYYEPAAIPSAASPQNTPSPYSTSPGATRFPNGHGSSDEHGVFPERFYDRAGNRVAPEGEFIRRTGYHDSNRGRNRDRNYRNGPYNNHIERHPRTLNNSWTYDSSRYNNTTNAGSQSETGYNTTPSDACSERRNSDQGTRKNAKSRSGSRSPSPEGSTSSRSPSRSRSRSSSSSSSSSASRDTSSTGSPKSRRKASNQNSDDRRPLAICVKNLPLRSSDTSLKDGLFHEYKKHGKVTWVKVIGQNSDRHAIVCFKKPEDVEKALEVSYDKLFFGCKIEVEPYAVCEVDDVDLRPYEADIDEYHPKATRTLFIGNLEKDVTASDLRKHFDQFGEIIEIDIKKQGAVSSYAFCQYSDIVSVVKAIRKMDGEHLGNNRIKLGFGKSMPYNCVWIDGVNENVTEKYLKLQFEPFGTVGRCIIDREKGQALVSYEQVLHAQQAVAKMRGFVLKNTKLQVDFASRECQECFFERLEKLGLVSDRTYFEEKCRDTTGSRSFDSSAVATRFSRYDTPTRPRTSSYSSRSSAAASQVTSAIPSPGTPGSVTPRGAGSRSRVARFYDYEQSEYPDRHFRSYDEYSQGSAASHEDTYEHDYVYANESPTHLDPLEVRVIQTVVDSVPFAPPDIRNLQKERVHLLEQLEECPSSGDELISPKKRLKLELLDSSITSDVIIEANRDHRKVMEVRRLSDANLRHHSRRPSVDSAKYNKDLGHDRNYMPHAVGCKRRKTASSDSGSRVHHYDHSGSESVGGSRPGTPLCDEKPENFPPSEPRRVPRDRDGPLTLPLPKFAAQLMNRGSVSVAGIKGQKDATNILSSPPPAATSPRISNARPPSPVHVPPPASPPPRPVSLSSNSSDSGAATPPSPSLDERIRSLDEKYEKWSGSRALSAAGGDALALLDANREKFRLRHKLLDLDLKEVQPSEIVKSVMAKRSVFDEDLKRLENVGEKYEPKDFGLFSRTTTTTSLTPIQHPPTISLPATSTLKLASPITTQLPKTPTMLSPRSTASAIPAAKGLQYPFPSHPPVQMSPVTLPAVPSPTTVVPSTPLLAPVTTTVATSTAATTTVTPQRSVTMQGENRLKPSVSAGAPTSKVIVSRGGATPPAKANERSQNVNIPSEVNAPGSVTTSAASNNGSGNKFLVKSSDKASDKITCRRDSNNSSSPRADVKTRRNSDTSARRIEDIEKFSDSVDKPVERAKSEERKRDNRLEKVKLENERLEREKAEKERIEKERVEKEKQEKERLERERLEKERQERESELEKQRLEKERLEKERLEMERLEKEKQEKERAEREKAKLEKERAEKERLEHERLEKERLENERLEKEKVLEQERLERERRKEREEKEKKEERDRKEKAERERKDRERQALQEKELLEKQEKERKEGERKEREELERKEREEKELRVAEQELLEKERAEKEKQEKDRKREDDRNKHKEDNHHEKRKEDHKHRENHSETKHKENNIDSKLLLTKDDKSSKDSHEVHKKDSHASHDNSSHKNKHNVDKDTERRKESIKENRDNNIHDRHKNLLDTKDHKERAVVETRHMSIDLEKTRPGDSLKSDASRRKERNNSLPANLGIKRRMSSHEIFDSIDESKRIKLSSEHRKLSERRDSKDSNRSDDKPKCSSKHKNNHIKSHDKHNSTKDCDEKRKEKEKEREERHKKHKLEKQKSKSKSREKECRESPVTPKSPLTDKDFLAKLNLRATEDVEKEKQQRKEAKEKRKESVTEQEKKDEKKPTSGEDKPRKEKDKPSLSMSETKEKEPHKHREETLTKQTEDRKLQKRDRIRKVTNSTDSDSDEPKKHSIFDIVDDEPAYISMYDKVKARSCKNMQKQEEEKRQEKIKAKFSQLKQSRARREEKKRSTSWDEDSDSERDGEMKFRRCPKMLIDSSDESQERKGHKKRDTHSDSDNFMRHIIKSEIAETTDDDIKSKHLLIKPVKSRIASDTSEDEYKKKNKLPVHINSGVFSENDQDLSLQDPEVKPEIVTTVKSEIERLIKKERRNSKFQEFQDPPVFGEYMSAFEAKLEKHNNKQHIIDNTTDDEAAEIKKERSERKEKKHKKKQKKQKHSTSDESTKMETDTTQSEVSEKKHHDKKKDHCRKDKKRDKIRDGREKSKKSKKTKSETKNSELKRDGKMENIFGSLSEDSETGVKETEPQKPSFLSDENAQHPLSYNSDTEQRDIQTVKVKEEKDREHEREEHKRRKEKRRREKERRLQEAAAAVAELHNSNDTSMDYADMAKQLEANIKDDTDEVDLKNEDEPSNHDTTQDIFGSSEHNAEQKKDKEERKEGKEKKKKRKKSKEEKSKHHHHHHHDKNKVKSPDVKKDASLPEVKIEIPEEKTPTQTSQSLPSIFDIHSPTEEKSSPDFNLSPATRDVKPIISPIPTTPTTSKEKKREKLIPGFGTEIDEKIHESAVKSISEFEPAAKPEEPVVKEEVKEEKPPVEEKPRVVISQEETEDAVAALLGESFGGEQFDECYTEEVTNVNDVAPNITEENNVQDDEEMRQAVQSLSSGDLDAKPDTPQSEHDLQIDTDTEEQEESSVPLDQPVKTTGLPNCSSPLKVTEAPFFQDEKLNAQAPVIFKSTPNIGSPPSLTPIKPVLPIPTVIDTKKNLEDQPKSLPLLPEQQQPPRTVISQSWMSTEKKSVSGTVNFSDKSCKPPLMTSSHVPALVSQAASLPTTTLKTYGSPITIKMGGDSQNYPPLAAISKEPLRHSPTLDQKVILGQNTPKSPNTAQLHNLPARSPVQVSKPPISTHENLSPKAASSLNVNRLPITPVMVSKPLQPTTVILPQSKMAGHTLEPPKLVSPLESRIQERPKMVFQPSGLQPPYSAYIQSAPRGLLQPTNRHMPPSGLLVHTRHFPPPNFVGSIPPQIYNMSALSNKDNMQLEKAQTEAMLKLSQPPLPSNLNLLNTPHPQNKPTVVLPLNNPHPPVSTSTNSKLVLQQTPVLTCLKPNVSHNMSPKPCVSPVIPSISHSMSPKPNVSPVITNVSHSISPKPCASPVMSTSPYQSPKRTPVISEAQKNGVVPSTTTEPTNQTPIVQVTSGKPTTPVITQAPSEAIVTHLTVPESGRTSTPSPVIVPNPMPEIKTNPISEVKDTYKPPSPVKLAIEEVTDELNMSLKKEVDDVVKEENKPVVDNDNKSIVKEQSEDQPKPKADEPPERETKPETVPVDDKTNITENKPEIDVSSPEKKDVSNDTDLANEDPLDTKEDSDYWSAKEVNIDSVIKTLCSADELSEHGSEHDKDEPPDTKVCMSTEKELATPEKKEEATTNETKTEQTTDIEDQQHETTPARGGRGRGRGSRGRRGRGGVERGGIQTRRAKLSKEVAVPAAPPATPTKRGRGGRPKNERKGSKSETENAPSDVYEFKEDSDDNKEQRPRLVLTIKSSAASSTSNSHTTAIVKEITKDGAKEIGKDGKEILPESPVKPTESKDEFASPQQTSNTRKSRRLQEKDISRNTVDDTIEDVVKNTIQTRASSNQRRSGRQGINKSPQTAVSPQLDAPRKSPRGRKPRRGSEATSELSSSEETIKDEVTKPVESPKPPVPSTPPAKEPEKPVDAEKEKPEEVPKEKPFEGLKAAMLRRIKGELSNKPHEPTQLIDPVTGLLIPMRECEEGRYIPLPGSSPNDELARKRAILEKELGTGTVPVTTASAQSTPVEPPKTQASVIAQPLTVVQQPVSKPHSLKAHVLSSQAAKAVVTQQVSTTQTKLTTPLPQQTVPSVHQPVVISKVAPTPTTSKIITHIITKPVTSVVISKTIVTPASQHLNINTSLPLATTTVTHSPRPYMPVSVTSKPQVKPPLVSPGQQVLLPTQQKQFVKQPQQVPKPQVGSTIPNQPQQIVNTQMAHMKHQNVMKQVIVGKTPLGKPVHPLHQQVFSAQLATPPQSKTQTTIGAARIIQGPPSGVTKGAMEPPKVDVNLPVLGRPTLSPQGQARIGSLPVSGYEASLHGETRAFLNRSRSPPPAHQNSPSPKGEPIQGVHFPPAHLRLPPEINPAHYIHPSHVMQYHQQLLRQQQLHLQRTAGLEKSGEEGEEAPDTSPPLELRRPGSVGLPVPGRAAAVPHSLHSPHDRATESPQMGQVYNSLHPTSRMPPYHPSQRYFDQSEPPPAHQRSMSSHGSLAALGSERGLAHMAPLGGTSTAHHQLDRAHPGHMQPDRPLSGHAMTAQGAHSIGHPVTPTINAQTAHTGHSMSAHMGGERMPGHMDRPLSAHGLMGAGLGAAGNLMGAVAKHIGADAPASQRGLQAATPPHASQVPPQAESLFMLLKQYPLMWQGLLALKNDQAAVQMYFVSGNDSVAKCSLPKNTDGSTPPLRIFQRMRLEPPQVEGVARKMQMENEHCMLLALPCGHDHMDVLKQSTNLTHGFITYLQQKQAAGIVNVAAPGTTQPPAYVVHIFPSCDFVNENLRRIAPSLLERVADIAHLLIVITTV